MKQEQAVEHAMNGIRNFLNRLRAEQEKPQDPSEPRPQPSVVFIDMKLGGFGFSEELATSYRDCLARLEAIHGRNPHRSLLSAREAKSLLHRTILRVGRPKRKPAPRSTFNGRVARELRTLRKKLLSPPREWIVSVHAQGFFVKELPATFGGVRFEPGTLENANVVAARISDPAPRRRRSKAWMAREMRASADSRKRLVEALSRDAIATTHVRAHDGRAAHLIGLERIHRTIDVVNFFAPYLADRPMVPMRAFLSSDGERVSVPFAASSVDDHSITWNEHHERWERLVLLIDPASAKADEVGYRRAHELLAREQLNEVEQRVVNALAWAGRATVASRTDEQFLLFTIALEALFTKSAGRGAATDRIRLRTAHLIGGPEATDRVALSKQMGELYDLRSEIVHGGDSSVVLEDDVKVIREIATLAIWSMLKDAPFTTMKRSAELEAWFEERMLR